MFNGEEIVILKVIHRGHFESNDSVNYPLNNFDDHIRYPDEVCQICRQRVFPSDPDKAIHDENAAAHAERVYCSHTYHHDCLILYMKTPPFDDGTYENVI